MWAPDHLFLCENNNDCILIAKAKHLSGIEKAEQPLHQIRGTVLAEYSRHLHFVSKMKETSDDHHRRNIAAVLENRLRSNA